METDDFSNYPRSIAEVRSDKTTDAADWSVRDALISTLRDIDNGTIKPLSIVMAVAVVGDEPTKRKTVVRQAGIQHVHESMGLIGWAAHVIATG